MSERITQAEFARRLGVKPQAVTNMIKSKKVTLGKDKKLDYQKALQQLERNSERTSSLTVKNKVDNQVDISIDNSDDEEEKSLMEWKEYEAKFRGLNRELDYEERKKNLIPKQKVQEDAYLIANILKEQFLSLPERLCNIFASESDAMVIREQWIKETKRVLNEIADKLQELP